MVSEKQEGREPLLVIEVKDMDSVPVVRYRGVDVKGNIAVRYEWETKSTEKGRHEYELEYVNKEENEHAVIEKVSGVRFE